MGHTIKVYSHRSKHRESLQANLNSVARLRSLRTVVMLAAAAGVETLPEPALLLPIPAVRLLEATVAGKLLSSTIGLDVGNLVSPTRIGYHGRIW
jgi:hypothetical protein